MAYKIKTFIGHTAKNSPVFSVIVSALLSILTDLWKSHWHSHPASLCSSWRILALCGLSSWFSLRNVLFYHVASVIVAENSLVSYSTSITIQWIYSVSHRSVQLWSKNRFVEENQLNSLSSSLINYMPFFKLNNEKKELLLCLSNKNMEFIYVFHT